MVLLHHPSDADAAGKLAAFLTKAGMTVVAPTAVLVDGAVVFLSAAALAESAWLARTDINVRLVPIQVGRIDADQVPERLRELNWIDWQPGNLGATFGFVLAGLLSDPAQRDLSRQLSHEAEAWQRAGRRDEMLIADYRRARRMVHVLHDLERDQLAAPTPTMINFVQRSAKVSRPRHRRRRNWRIGGVIATITALSAIVVTVPAIRLASYNNHEAIVTTGDPLLLSYLPEWSAANAAALLVNGTPAERTLAEGTLLQAMNAPWETSALQTQPPPFTATTFDHGTRAILSIGYAGTATFAVIDVRTTRVLWSIRVPGALYYVSVAPGGDTALALNRAAAIVINLATHAWHRVGAGTQFYDGWLGSNGVAVARMTDIHVAELNIYSGKVTDFGAYPSIISVAPQTPRGSAAALVQERNGRTALLDLNSHKVIASMPGGSSTETGTIAPSGRQAIVSGSDGQFWTFGAGMRPEPTGIAVPRLLSGLLWASGNRLVVYGQDVRGEVYYLPRAEPLGLICREDTRILQIVPDYGSDVVTCETPGGTSFWQLPAGPLGGRQQGESAARRATAGGVTVASRGASIQIRGPGPGATGWFQPLNGDITAAAVAPDGTQVVVGDALDGVAVIDVTAAEARVVTVWQSPDKAPVVAVGWAGGPVATTASGQTWRAGDCGACGTDAGLLNAYRARASGCFTTRQLQFMSNSTRLVLGLRECDRSW